MRSDIKIYYIRKVDDNKIYYIRKVDDNKQLSDIKSSDITIYSVETSDIRRREAESDIILSRLNKS